MYVSYKCLIIPVLTMSTVPPAQDSERNHRSPRARREKFGENVCVRTRLSGDRTS